MGMNVKEAIDVLERSCDFHYEETDKCYGCLFENIGWCGENFHDSLLVLLKEKETIESNEWIKCSDKMPEEQETIFAKLKGTDKWKPAMFEKMSDDVRVVVIFEDGTRKVHHSYTVDGKWDVEKKPPKRTVTHWMPNPELPKEGR